MPKQESTPKQGNRRIRPSKGSSKVSDYLNNIFAEERIRKTRRPKLLLPRLNHLSTSFEATSTPSTSMIIYKSDKEDSVQRELLRGTMQKLRKDDSVILVGSRKIDAKTHNGTELIGNNLVEEIEGPEDVLSKLMYKEIVVTHKKSKFKVKSDIKESTSIDIKKGAARDVKSEVLLSNDTRSRGLQAMSLNQSSLPFKNAEARPKVKKPNNKSAEAKEARYMKDTKPLEAKKTDAREVDSIMEWTTASPGPTLPALTKSKKRISTKIKKIQLKSSPLRSRSTNKKPPKLKEVVNSIKAKGLKMDPRKAAKTTVAKFNSKSPAKSTSKSPKPLKPAFSISTQSKPTVQISIDPINLLGPCEFNYYKRRIT